MSVVGGGSWRWKIIGVRHQGSHLPEPGWTTGFLVVKRKKGPE
ncbi:hypothetical protein ACSU6B_10550 [Neobacillus sp. C211]